MKEKYLVEKTIKTFNLLVVLAMFGVTTIAVPAQNTIAFPERVEIPISNASDNNSANQFTSPEGKFDVKEFDQTSKVKENNVFLNKTAATAGSFANKYHFFPNTNDKLSDWAVFTIPTSGGQVRWWLLKNENPSPPGPGAATIADIPWGQSLTDLVPNMGNYTGDQLDDLILYRNNAGSPANTYISRNANGTANYFQWGISTTDTLGAEGDYDGDGKMDPTIVRSNGTNFVWWIYRSSDNTFMTFTYGLVSSDIALAGADYTGDGKADPAIARIAANGQITWFVGTTTGTQISQTAWGNFNTDFIVPGGDYDGDGKADFMVWRGFGNVNSVWYLRTNTGDISYTQFGLASGTAANRDNALRAGDYDGDGKTDIAVYRPSNLTFYVLRSSGGVQTQKWGIEGNTNMPIAFFGTL